MSLLPSDPPKPLPVVPCPTFDGHRVKWEPWSAAPTITHIDPSCNSCAFAGPLSVSSGITEPNPGEMYDGVRMKRSPSGREYGVTHRYPAHPVLRLWATLCPACYALEVIEPTGLDGAIGNVDVILCDGCDRYSAAGASFEEARLNLVALGGWTAAETDWDLCPGCNPASEEPTSIRAAAAIRASKAAR